MPVLRIIDFSGSKKYSDVPELITFPGKNTINYVTKIVFPIISKLFVTLIVYDSSGKEITTLVNEEKDKGYYGIEFNCCSLENGVYHLILVGGNYVNSTVVVKTKKILLLKQ